MEMHPATAHIRITAIISLRWFTHCCLCIQAVILNWEKILIYLQISNEYYLKC